MLPENCFRPQESLEYHNGVTETKELPDPRAVACHNTRSINVIGGRTVLLQRAVFILIGFQTAKNHSEPSFLGIKKSTLGDSVSPLGIYKCLVEGSLKSMLCSGLNNGATV